jgi:hypothetical protein
MKSFLKWEAIEDSEDNPWKFKNCQTSSWKVEQNVSLEDLNFMKHAILTKIISCSNYTGFQLISRTIVNQIEISYLESDAYADIYHWIWYLNE